MSRITISSGVSWAALHQSLGSWLPDDRSKALILTPSSWKTESVQSWFPGYSISSTVQLLESYLASKSGQKRLLSKSAMTNLLNAIIYQASGEEKIVSARFLNIETSYAGYVRALTELLIDFRENGPESLLAALSELKSGPLSARERDLIDIHDELESVLQSRNLFDFRRALSAFLQDEETGRPHAFLPEHPTTLVVFGFSHLSDLETKLLSCWIRRCERTVVARCRNASAAAVIFKSQAPLESFVAGLKQEYANEVSETDIKREHPAASQKLAELVFHDDKSARMLQPDSSVQVVEANNRFLEVTYLAREICRLREAGVACEHMRLVVPAYEVYASLLTEVFPAYGIPYRLSQGTPPAFYPLAQLVLRMMNHALAPSPFALRDAIFSSPYVTYSCEVTAAELREFANHIEEGLLPDEEALATLLPAPKTFALNFAVLQKTRRRAAQAIRSSEPLHPLQLIVRHLRLQHENNPEELGRAVFQVAANYFVLARAEKALYVWRSSMTPEEFSQGFEKALVRFHVEKNLSELEVSKDVLAQNTIQRERQVQNHMRELLGRLQEQFTTLGGEAGRKFPLADLIQAFSGMVRDPEHYVPEERSEGVLVCTPKEAPLGFWEATFVAGLIDGDFPEQVPFNFLQPKSEGRALTGDLVWVDRDRLALYQILASTSRHLFISYPVSEGNKKLLISPFVTEVRKCFVAEPPPEVEEPRPLYTIRERLSFIAQSVDRTLERAIPVLRQLKRNAPEFFPQIIAILECDGLRASISSFSRFDGLMSASAALSSIKEQLGNEAVMEVRQLERYAGCPLRFLFDDLMQLKPEYLSDYHPDTTERGVLMRKLLTGYSRGAASAGRIPENAATMLHEIATEGLSQNLTEKDNLFSQRFKNGLLAGLQSTEGDKPRRPGVLSAFLEFEQTAPDRITPYLANLSFNEENGKALQLKKLPFAIPVEIARVDLTSDGKHLVIFNYSSADLGDVEKIGKGLRFDLPLLILALRKNLPAKDKKKTVAAAGVYLVRSHRDLKRGGYFGMKDLQASRRDGVTDETPIFSGQRKYGFLPAANFEEELKTVAQRVAHIVGLIHRGRFHLPICSVKDQICGNCHFARVCRIEQLRMDKLYAQVDGEETYKPLRRVE